MKRLALSLSLITVLLCIIGYLNRQDPVTIPSLLTDNPQFGFYFDSNYDYLDQPLETINTYQSYEQLANDSEIIAQVKIKDFFGYPEFGAHVTVEKVLKGQLEDEEIMVNLPFHVSQGAFSLTTFMNFPPVDSSYFVFINKVEGYDSPIYVLVDKLFGIYPVAPLNIGYVPMTLYGEYYYNDYKEYTHLIDNNFKYNPYVIQYLNTYSSIHDQLTS